MEQKYFIETMEKFPKEFNDLILTDPLLHNCIQSGINEKLEYTKILEKTLLFFVKHSNNIMNGVYEYSEEPLITNEHLADYRKSLKNKKPSVFDDDKLYKKYGGV